MITPAIKGRSRGDAAGEPRGAGVGDAIAIRIRSIDVTSLATASGNDRTIEGRLQRRPVLREGLCKLRGRGRGDRRRGDRRGRGAPILLFAPSDLVGIVARMRPFMGQLGTMPAIDLPDSHNAGDFGAFLVGAPHSRAVTAEQLAARTDGHPRHRRRPRGGDPRLPVKVPGGGVYLGDMHAMQGDGEIAGHTADVAGVVSLQVSVIKDLGIDGPVLFPIGEDLPFLARPLTAQERADAEALAQRYGGAAVEESLPVSFVGTGPDLNSAVENGLGRAAAVLGMEVPEVMNRDDQRRDRDRPRTRRRAGDASGAGAGARRAAWTAWARAVRVLRLAARDGEDQRQRLSVAQDALAAHDLALHRDGDAGELVHSTPEIRRQRGQQVGDRRSRGQAHAAPAGAQARPETDADGHGGRGHATHRRAPRGAGQRAGCSTVRCQWSGFRRLSRPFRTHAIDLQRIVSAAPTALARTSPMSTSCA